MLLTFRSKAGKFIPKEAEMSTAITIRDVGDVKVIEFGKSKIDTATIVDLAFGLAGGKGRVPKLLLDFGQVKTVEPVAIRQLEARTRDAEKAGGEVRLLHLGRIRNPQTATQLALICPVHEDEAEAVRNFR